MCLRSRGEGRSMSALPTPEQRAEALVTAGPKEPGGTHYVWLHVPGGEPVALAGHPNPDVVRREAGAVRRFGAAIREATAPAMASAARRGRRGGRMIPTVTESAGVPSPLATPTPSP